ncbi:MAG: hypothetical protein K6E91_05980 [Butyrivibrio sp.]|nr:hypothetical protein [Butyrivibrio sp.]
MLKKRITSMLLVVLMLFSITALNVRAKENVPSEEQTDDTMEAAAPENEAAADDLVKTNHTAVIRGKSYSYTATVGKMAVTSAGEQCDVFFIAYTLDNQHDASKRPITFAFNGGPGAASFYANFLCMGPKRMDVDEIGHATTLPATFIDNDNSLLDLTDLVFIDAIGTGYSKAENEENFIGYDNDIRTIGDFIRLYINRNKRWSSPKYVAGESYGTTRAVGLCQYLASTYSLGLNGLMLISSVNDFSTLSFGTGNDLPYASYLPTYAADAWYHGKLDDKYQDMELSDYLDEVREFVSDDYVEALFMGRNIKQSDKDEIANDISKYIGVDKDFVLKHNLRIDLDDFLKELLADDKLVAGRYDGRFTGPVINASIYDGTSDPSTFDVDLPLVSAVNQFIVDELNYQTDDPYIPLSLDVNYNWGFNTDNYYLAQEDIIKDCMTANSNLKIWVLCGYYDGATPFYAAEWTYNHVYMDDSRKDNLSFTYYPSGHMFYLDLPSLEQFREDAERWYQ